MHWNYSTYNRSVDGKDFDAFFSFLEKKEEDRNVQKKFIGWITINLLRIVTNSIRKKERETDA